jgi:hypothetical protein
MVRQEIGHSVDALDAGVAAAHRLVSGGEVATTTGRLCDRTRKTRADPQAYDTAARAELWQRSRQLVDHSDAS